MKMTSHAEPEATVAVDAAAVATVATPLLDWHKYPALQGVLNARIHNRMAHAYLIHGDSDSVRNDAAHFLARIAACLQPHEDGTPCGTCRVCRQIAEDSYSELYELSPSDKRGGIKVGDNKNPEVNTLRYFESQFYLTGSSVDGRKIGIIYDADAMNREAQNALLKTLEEPPEGSLFLLCTGNPSALLPTTRSRCQLVPVLDNLVVYDFAGAKELAELLSQLFFDAAGDLVLAAQLSEKILAIADALTEESEARSAVHFERAVAQAEDGEDKALLKRLNEQQEGAAASAYLKLRDSFLSLLHTFFAQLYLLERCGDFVTEELPNFELLPEAYRKRPIDPVRASTALKAADMLLYRLRFQMDENLAMRAFALRVSVGHF